MSSEAPARGFLLDTHTAIFSLLDDPPSLSRRAKAAVDAGPNFLSVVSYWEVAIKSMKGRIDVGDPRIWWTEALDKLVATPLLLRPEHVDALLKLPPVHKDPFDRILIAQAMAEGLVLVSMDAEVARYASAGLRIIG
ncbi:MAG: type II toxin-antitoxin system VapC family toxin [Terracidiphilus sp.]